MNLRINALLILVCCLACNNLATAQSTQSESVRSSGGMYVDHGTAITLDEDGNMYVTGGFQSEVQFGGTRLSSKGDSDAFIAKYNAMGEPIWCNQVGGDTVLRSSLTEYGADILFYDGFIYVTGVFLSTAKFSNIEVVSHGMDDIFLAKYALNGQLIWVKTAGGASQDVPHALAIDNLGGIYLTGSFQGKAKFSNTQLESQNSTDMFFVKYSTNGDLLWARQSQSEQEGLGRKVTCNEQGCIVAAEFKGRFKLGDITSTNIPERIGLAKYSLEGKPLWLKEIGENNHATVEDVVLNNKNLYMAGSFNGVMKCDANMLYSKGLQDAYLISLDENGNFVWFKSFGSVGNDAGKSISIDRTNTVCLGGNFQQTIDFNDGSVLDSRGADDIFLAQLTGDGALLSLESIGGAGQDHLNDIGMANDQIFLTGFFRESINVRDFTQKSNGYSDILVAKINKETREHIIRGGDLVKIYPIPSKGEFNIESTTKISSLELINELGQVVNNVYVNFKTENCAEVKLGRNKGVYFISGYVDGKKFTRKVIVE